MARGSRRAAPPHLDRLLHQVPLHAGCCGRNAAMRKMPQM